MRSLPRLRALRAAGILFMLLGGASGVFAQALQITTPSPLPSGVVGIFYSLLFESVGPSPVNWSVSSGALPPGMTIGAAGTLSGVASTTGTFDFAIQASGGSPTQSTTRSYQIVVAPPLAVATPARLPNAGLGAAYSVSLAATGGRAPYSWTTSIQPLPPGLSLSAGGVLSGTPTLLGTFTFSLQAADAYMPSNQTSRTFTLVVSTSLQITTESLASAFQDVPYSQQVQVVGGIAPFTWIVSSGTLPSGLTLSAAGVIQGSSPLVAAETFSLTVTDISGASLSREFTLRVDPQISSLSAPALPANMDPADAVVVGLQLASPHPSPLAGQLILSFTPSAEVPGDDPMTRFSTGGRVVDFAIPAGGTAAVFPSNVMLLSGTVAGMVQLTASFTNGPGSLPVGSVTIVPTVPRITEVTAARTGDGMDIRITGYSPLRRVTNATFVFDVRVGNALQQISLSRSVDAEFRAWFVNPASTAFGSAFSFLQSFVVAGGAPTSIESVTVRLTNAQGSASVGPVPLQ